MRLRGIEFGNVFGASGVQGLFGEGYWFHPLLKPIGLDFEGMTLVSKTATLNANEGNMPLTEQYTPRDLFPDCIKVKIVPRLALNAVRLSNPGLEALLGTGLWQMRTEPFLISFMSLAETAEKRLDEYRAAVDMLGGAKDQFSAPFGFQPNLSCPNTGHKPSELINESTKVLEVLAPLGVPVVPKYSVASAPVRAVLELNQNPNCDAICVSNTIPWGWSEINWENVWGSKDSPLARLGGGGLSGAILKPFVCKWIGALRNAGFTKPINGGGGIFSRGDIWDYRSAGASSVFLGSVAMLRPWRVRGLIKEANQLVWN
ncbi:MAG: hypothetical protein HY457_03410 [Parcubacteria group bacterium]|nr:hypothetical protein [Parcubacteria group bacterium]